MNSTAAKAAIAEAIDQNWDAELRFLQELIRQPSVRGATNEAQDLIGEQLRAMGMSVEEVYIDETRLSTLPGYSPVDWPYAGLKNLVGRLRARDSGGKSLILNGHIDVVSPEPVDSWQCDPWGGEIVNSRLLGRGAADMKSGVAAMIYSLVALQHSGIPLRGDVLVQSVIDEECSGNGTLACLAKGLIADAAVIPEPFGGAIVSASPGVLWCRIRVRGFGAHASVAGDAVNAAEKAFVVIAALRQLEAEWNRPERRHPAFQDVEHPLNFNIGTFHAGDWPSTVPELCTLEVRLSCFPGEDLAIVQRLVSDRLQAAAAADSWLSKNPPEVRFIGFRAEGAIYDTGGELGTILAANHAHVTGGPPAVRPTTGTIDNRFFQLYYGIPTICYGPQGGQLHAPNEWVDLESIRTCTKVLAGVLVDWCGIA